LSASTFAAAPDGDAAAAAMSMTALWAGVWSGVIALWYANT
jgi:hypothetical protein